MSDPLEDFLATYQPPAPKTTAAAGDKGSAAAPPPKRDPIFDEIDALDDALVARERMQMAPSPAMPAGYATTTATTPRELRAENKQAGRESMQAGRFEDAAKAAAYGVARGGTLGFVDRAVGAGNAIGESLGATDQNPADPNAYRQGRREYLEGERQAAANHPLLYAGGEVAGGMVPGIAASPLRFAGRFGNPATLGAAAGVGNTTEDGPLRLLLGAGAGAAGGALGEATVGTLLRRMFRGAPRREENAMVRDVMESEKGRATQTTGWKLGRDIEDVRERLQNDPEVRAAVRLPAAEARPVVQRSVELARDGQDLRYEAADAALTREPLTVTQLLSKLVDAEGKLSDTELPLVKKALLALRDSVREDFAPRWAGTAEWHGERVPISLQQLRGWVTSAQSTAERAMGGINGTNAFKVPSKVSQLANDILEERLDKAAAKGAAGSVSGIRESDRKVSALLAIDRALEDRGRKELAESVGLSKRISDQNANLAWPALAVSGHFGPAAAVAAHGPIMRAVDRGTRAVNDRVLAPIQRGAVAGIPNSLAKRQAIESAFPQSIQRALMAPQLASPPVLPSLRQQLTGVPVAAPQPSDYRTGTAIQ